MSGFGERLTNLRKENGYDTRAELAEKLNIPVTTLRNYETGAREPGHVFIRRISQLFNVSADYLLCLTDDKEVLHSFRLRGSEMSIVKKYRSLDEHGKHVVNILLQAEFERCSASSGASSSEPDVDAALEEIKKQDKGAV